MIILLVYYGINLVLHIIKLLYPKFKDFIYKMYSGNIGSNTGGSSSTGGPSGGSSGGPGGPSGGPSRSYRHGPSKRKESIKWSLDDPNMSSISRQEHPAPPRVINPNFQPAPRSNPLHSDLIKLVEQNLGRNYDSIHPLRKLPLPGSPSILPLRYWK